jgi:hypothetical protein
MLSEDAVTVTSFEVCPIMASTLPAVLAMHWNIKEKAIESRVQFSAEPTLSPGGVVPLNPAALQLLQEMGLLSILVERRQQPRS